MPEIIHLVVEQSLFELSTSIERAGSNLIVGGLVDCTSTSLAAFDGDLRLLLVNEAMQRALGLTRVDPFCPASTMLASSSWLSSNSSVRLLNLLCGELEEPITVDGRDGTAFTASSRVDVDGNVFLSLVPTGPTALSPAHRDPLTGLADRTAFQDRLNRLCAAPESPVAVMLIDLDRFKAVNDTLGHPAGDQLLKLVAQRLRGTLRHADVVSRLGGDEFAVAMVGAGDAQVAAERLVDVLSRPYLVERHFAVIGASIGLAITTPGGTGADALIRAADLALYQAKANGRGVVCVFNEEMDRRARNRNALADDLRRAIPLQQLELHFQPQICLQTTELNGFEALVRWNHPTLGLLGPDKFIPLAEEMGLILPLGEWVLGEACRQAASWSAPVSVAVNVSPKQLLDRKRLINVIAAALANTGLPAHRLEIEITETALVNEAEALEVLTTIRAMGVKLSMDDFGTGYSSLSQLRRFPFDKLKIDRSFIRDLGDSAEAGAVVSAISALGRSLGMRTTAEGVETSEQEATCRADGCTEMQGYLVSKPVPAGEVANLMQKLRLTKDGASLAT